MRNRHPLGTRNDNVCPRPRRVVAATVLLAAALAAAPRGGAWFVAATTPMTAEVVATQSSDYCATLPPTPYYLGWNWVESREYQCAMQAASPVR